MSDLQDPVEGIRTLSQAHQAEGLAACQGPQCHVTRLGTGFHVGQKVLDTITGLEGEVISANVGHFVVQPAIVSGTGSAPSTPE